MIPASPLTVAFKIEVANLAPACAIERVADPAPSLALTTSSPPIKPVKNFDKYICQFTQNWDCLDEINDDDKNSENKSNAKNKRKQKKNVMMIKFCNLL